MKVNQIDIKTAYLNGCLNEDIFMEPPKHLRPRLSISLSMNQKTVKLGRKLKICWLNWKRKIEYVI